MVSATGCNLLQSFRESLLPMAALTSPEEAEYEDIASLMQRLPSDTRPFEKFLTTAKGCFLLLMLKQYLNYQYDLTDSQDTQYLPPVRAAQKESRKASSSTILFNQTSTELYSR